jgi:hypothetical protein
MIGRTCGTHCTGKSMNTTLQIGIIASNSSTIYGHMDYIVQKAIDPGLNQVFSKLYLRISPGGLQLLRYTGEIY